MWFRMIPFRRGYSRSASFSWAVCVRIWCTTATHPQVILIWTFGHNRSLWLLVVSVWHRLISEDMWCALYISCTPFYGFWLECIFMFLTSRFTDTPQWVVLSPWSQSLSWSTSAPRSRSTIIAPTSTNLVLCVDVFHVSGHYNPRETVRYNHVAYVLLRKPKSRFWPYFLIRWVDGTGLDQTIPWSLTSKMQT